MVGEEFDKVKTGRRDPIGACRHGGFEHLCVPDRGAAARHQEIWGVDPDALRKAALEVDLPEAARCWASASSSTAKAPRWPGRNERSFPVVIQYVDDKSYVVWPKSQSQREAVLPLPAGTTYSYK